MLIAPCNAPLRGGESVIVRGRPSPAVCPSGTLRFLPIEALREETRRDPAVRVQVWSSLTVKVADIVTGPEPVCISVLETVPSHIPTRERLMSAGSAEASGDNDPLGRAHPATSTMRLATRLARYVAFITIPSLPSPIHVPPRRRRATKTKRPPGA